MYACVVSNTFYHKSPESIKTSSVCDRFLIVCAFWYEKCIFQLQLHVFISAGVSLCHAASFKAYGEQRWPPEKSTVQEHVHPAVLEPMPRLPIGPITGSSAGVQWGGVWSTWSVPGSMSWFMAMTPATSYPLLITKGSLIRDPNASHWVPQKHLCMDF